MQRGLVRRYFTMCCSIILTSIILLGVIFMVFAAQYFKEDKLGALEKNAKYAAEMTERYIISVDGRYQLVNNAALTSSWIPMAKGAGCGHLPGKPVGRCAVVYPSLHLQPHGIWD